MSESLGQELMSIIIQYKGIFIAVILLTIGKIYILNNIYLVQMFKKISFMNLFKKSEYINLTLEEKKLYKLTQCNTLLNRDMLDKRDIYLKKVQSEYKDIYGNKGDKFFKDMQKKVNKTSKKNCKVRFSNNIQYSID